MPVRVNARTYSFRMAAWLLIFSLLASAVPAPAQETGGRKYLSIDYQEFPTFGAAVKNSIAPTNLRANAGAVLRNTVDPLNPARYVAAVVVVELQRQLASGQGIDVGKIASNLSPAGLAVGYLGGQAGELMGAGVQSILANVAGPVGGMFGFALRPVLWYLGSSVGQDLGKGIREGRFEPGKAFAGALRNFNPVVDASQMIGDGIGSVIGQALIPVPLIGAMVGGIIGGTVALLAGQAFVKTDTGKAIDEALRRRLGNLANATHSANGPNKASPAAPSESAGPAAPSTSTAMPAAPASSAANRAAYQRLIDAMRSGDRARIQAAHEAMRQGR